MKSIKKEVKQSMRCPDSPKGDNPEEMTQVMSKIPQANITHSCLRKLNNTSSEKYPEPQPQSQWTVPLKELQKNVGLFL